MKAGQPASTDVLWGNSGGVLQASKVGLTSSFPWMAYLGRPMLKAEPGFDPVGPNGVALASASTLVGITYNSDMVKGDDIPKSMLDVLHPKWKGKIASTPYAAGLREFAMDDLLGVEVMTDYTKKLSKHIGGLFRCGSMDKLTSGEFAMLVFSCGDQYVNQAKRTGIPLGYALVKEAVVSHTRYGSVPVHSQAPAAAALFVAYLHTPEGQKWMWDAERPRLPPLSGVPPAQGAGCPQGPGRQGGNQLAAVAGKPDQLQRDPKGTGEDPGGRPD